MGKSSRGRRAVAEQLGMLDEKRSAARRGNEDDDEPRGGAGGRGAGGRGAGPRAKARGRRGKLPSDRAIASAMIVRIFRWVFRLVAFCILASVALVIIYRIVDPPITPLMLIRPMEGIAQGDLVGIDKHWVSIDDVNPALLRSVIAAEDGRFFTHNGIDWKAVDQAQKRNERSKGKKVYGASTITMQCARNVFLWQGRNYVRKALEVYFTYLMEFFWGKKRILEVYVNVIEWGDGIYGVEAASQKYFGIPASQLSARQAALLASVLPNPRKWSPAAPTGYINGRASMIQGRASGVGLTPIRDAATSTAPKKSGTKGRKK
jgi:monofunctional biosynthetic peptidoglycan transglycosylase